MQQGSPEWFAARLGRITASRISDIMAKGRGGAPSKTRENYIVELALERLTSETQEAFVSAAMEWGTVHEADAKVAYGMATGQYVEPVGFVLHPMLPNSGASPDGLVEDGLIEIKCPNSATHLGYLRSQTIPRNYILQMQWQMECTERRWCDFVSYDPRFPERHQLWIQRVEFDDGLVAEIREAVTEAEKEIQGIVDDLS